MLFERWEHLLAKHLLNKSVIVPTDVVADIRFSIEFKEPMTINEARLMVDPNDHGHPDTEYGALYLFDAAAKFADRPIVDVIPPEIKAYAKAEIEANNSTIQQGKLSQDELAKKYPHLYEDSK